MQHTPEGLPVVTEDTARTVFEQFMRDRSAYVSYVSISLEQITVENPYLSVLMQNLLVEATPDVRGIAALAGVATYSKVHKYWNLKKEPPTTHHRRVGCSLRSGRFLWSARILPRNRWQVFATGHRPSGKFCAF